jgi:hypothetical protein
MRPELQTLESASAMRRLSRQDDARVRPDDASEVSSMCVVPPDLGTVHFCLFRLFRQGNAPELPDLAYLADA